MATSSIFTNVVVDNEEAAAKIAQAFEEFELQGSPQWEITSHVVTDPKEIQELVSMWGGNQT